MISAAVAAGLTATFGCPFGGVFFSIEVTSNYFMIGNLWKSFFCSTISILAFQFLHLSPLLGTFKNTNYEKIPINHEIILYAVLGYLCGVISGLLNLVLAKLIIFRTKIKAPFASSRYKYSIAVALFISLIQYPIPFLRESDKKLID